MFKGVNFKNVLKETKKTVKKQLKQLGIPKSKIEFIKNNAKNFRVIIDFNNCLCEIIAEKPTFAPYRFISLSVVSLRDNSQSYVFLWYDSQDDTLEIITKKITECLHTASHTYEKSLRCNK